MTSRAPSVANAIALLLTLAGGLAAARPATAADAGNENGFRPAPEAALQAIDGLRARVGAEGFVRTSPESGRATFVSVGNGAPFARRAEKADDAARIFLLENAAAFGLSGSKSELRVESSKPADAVGMEHVRLRQLHGGIPVAGGEMTVHLRESGIVSAHVRAVPDLEDVATTATVTPQAALARVRQGLDRSGLGADAEWSEPRLEILSRAHLGGAPGPTRLAWFLEGRKKDLRQYVWIDARQGLVLLSFSQLPHAKDREVYDGNDLATLPGTTARSEGDPATGDADTDDAYDYAGDTYDYFSATHGRDSYDDAGATLHSTVHHCPSPGECPYLNAFWNGTQMVYGEGFPAADDVVGHELSHAVTEYTANLFYYMQSGALNESYSDVFGETMDQLNGSGSDTVGDKWKMGEDVPVFGAIRNMMDPTVFGDPGKMSDPQFWCPTRYSSPHDAGGVHINSGIPNHAFALITDGGTYNSETVTGIGFGKSDRIWYRALDDYLTSSSNFDDADAAFRQSCTDLVGLHGITAGNCTELGEALDAVEMADPVPCGGTAPETPPLCPAGMAPGAFILKDDLEDLPTVLANWAPGVLSGGSAWSYPASLGPFASSGTESFWGYDIPGVSDSFVALTFDLPIHAADSYLHFQHSYGFEFDVLKFYDGGRVEYSTNGGSTWSDGGGLIDAGATYGGVLDSGFGNPLGGSSAFVGYSRGYTGTRIPLGALAGMSFRPRFRIATDVTGDDYGWWIDDVQVYRCFDDSLIFADGFESGDTSQWTLTTP